MPICISSYICTFVMVVMFCNLFCRVVSLCMSPINDSFMSGSLDHSVRIWDLRVNACQVEFLFFLCEQSLTFMV